MFYRWIFDLLVMSTIIQYRLFGKRYTEFFDIKLGSFIYERIPEHIKPDLKR